MSPKPKILLVHLTQYGRHTNSYKSLSIPTSITMALTLSLLGSRPTPQPLGNDNTNRHPILITGSKSAHCPIGLLQMISAQSPGPGVQSKRPTLGTLNLAYSGPIIPDTCVEYFSDTELSTGLFQPFQVSTKAPPVFQNRVLFPLNKPLLPVAPQKLFGGGNPDLFPRHKSLPRELGAPPSIFGAKTPPQQRVHLSLLTPMMFS